MLDSDLELKLPYVTGDLPGIGGALRATPDHFVVEELPLYLPQGEGQHLYVRLTKVGLTTKEVQARLAQIFGVGRDAVGFAGMKDKVARTTQTFSINVGFVDDRFVADAPARIQDQLPVEVHWCQLHRNKLKPGHLLGNRFRITVTDLALPADEVLRRAEAIAQRLRRPGVPNFFGPQRFGPGGANVRQGLEILLGRRTKQDRWLRRFLISSYQSYLCNRYLARRLERGAFHRLLAGDVAKKYDTGGMFQVEDLAAEQARYEAQEISFTAPIYGPKMWPATDGAGALEQEILDEAAITLEHLRRARVEGTRRLGRLLVPDLQLSIQEDGLMVEFALPKGAFATTVLREFMKNAAQEDALPEEET